MRRIRLNKENQDQQKKEVQDRYKKPPIGLERKIMVFEKDGQSQKEIEQDFEQTVKDMESKGYVFLKHESEVEKIWGELSMDSKHKMKTKRRLYFVWKFSGWLDLLLKNNEKEDYIDKLSDSSILQVMGYISNIKILSSTYLIDETGFPQLTTKDGRMHERDGNGKLLYSRDDVISYPRRRSITIDDVPLKLIEKIIDDLSIKNNKKA